MKHKVLVLLLLGGNCVNYSLSLSDVQGYAQNAEDCTKFAVLLPYIWQLTQQGGNITQNDAVVLAYLKNVANQLKCPLSKDIIRAMSFIEGVEKVEAAVGAGEAAVVAGASAVEAEAGLAAQKVQQESVGMWGYIKSWFV